MPHLPRIVVLDGAMANPGDLSWDGLAALGELTVHERTPPDQIVARARPAEIILTNKTPLTRATLAQLPRLRCISVLATGCNVVDAEAARERGIPVCNVPGYSTPSVVQHTFALLLELTNQVGRHAAEVRAGAWCRAPDFSFWHAPLLELTGLTMGIVGWGAIGRGVAAVGQALGMRIVATSRRRPGTLPPGTTWASPAELLALADVVTLHCPLTPATEKLIDAAALARMKPTALLLTTARGPLLDEAAVAAALRDGKLGGLGADVLSTEPPRPDNPLLQAPRTVITPHQAWATPAARRRLLAESAANVRAFLAGTPRHVVNAVAKHGPDTPPR